MDFRGEVHGGGGSVDGGTNLVECDKDDQLAKRCPKTCFLVLVPNLAPKPKKCVFGHFFSLKQKTEPTFR